MAIDQTTGFGIEIECYLPEDVTARQAAEAVNARIGAGRCQYETYNHGRRDHWKVVTDGSLGDSSRGVEFVSPVLRGDAGLAEIREVCRALTDFGCTVSKKCGLHIHVGVGHPEVDFFKKLVKLFSTFEPVLDRLVPASRRASVNQYCRTLTHINHNALERTTSLNGIRDMIGNGRYAKLNLHAWDLHKTVEFRQHSGTLDGVKAANWTTICLLLVEAARRPSRIATRTVTMAPEVKARHGSKSWQVGMLMLRPEGVTADEARAAVGWPSISLPQQAKICGLAFTTERTGRVVRYRAVQTEVVATEAAPLEASLDGLASLIRADDELRGWIYRRAADLSGTVTWST